MRQEENQYLSCPPRVAKTLPKEIQNLIGYRRAGGALGYISDTHSPKVSWREGFDVLVPGSGSKL